MVFLVSVVLMVGDCVTWCLATNQGYDKSYYIVPEAVKKVLRRVSVSGEDVF